MLLLLVCHCGHRRHLSFHQRNAFLLARLDDGRREKRAMMALVE